MGKVSFVISNIKNSHLVSKFFNLFFITSSLTISPPIYLIEFLFFNISLTQLRSPQGASKTVFISYFETICENLFIKFFALFIFEPGPETLSFDPQ